MEHLAAGAFFANCKLPDGRHLKADRQQRYSAEYVILKGIGAMIEAINMERRSHSDTAPVNWEKLAADVQNLNRNKYPHQLPANSRRLKDRYRRHATNGFIFEDFIDKHFLNKNAAKVETSEQKAFIIKLLALRGNYPDTLVAEEYNLPVRAKRLL